MFGCYVQSENEQYVLRHLKRYVDSKGLDVVHCMEF
jgi:hypothetical protein